MLTWIVTMLKAIKTINPSNTFKVVGVKGTPQNKNIQIVYQVSGKATIGTEKPKILLKELMHLKGFSKQDSDLIYDLAMSERLCYSFKILSVFFEDNITKFEIEDVHTQYTLMLTASEITSSQKILEGFSPSDITMIYFQLLKESDQQQRNLKNEIRNAKIENNKNIYLFKSMSANE